MAENPYKPPVDPPPRGGPVPRTWVRLPLLLLGAFTVMAPWPLFAVATGIQEKETEALLYLGGITILFMLPVFLVGEPPDWFLYFVISAVWLAVLVIPAICAAVRNWSRRAVQVVLLAQSGFACAQAVLGFLMLLGRGV